MPGREELGFLQFSAVMVLCDLIREVVDLTNCVHMHIATGVHLRTWKLQSHLVNLP